MEPNPDRRMDCVLVAGCGDVGSAAAVRLRETGAVVTGLKRSPHGLPEGVVPLAADLRTGSGLELVPSRTDTLLFTAAVGRGAGPDDYRSLYVDGLRRTLDALAARGAPLSRVVFTASTAVYGQTDGSDVDEDSPTEPEDHRGAAMLAAEEVLRQFAGSHASASCVSLRLGGIYGPGRTYLIEAVRTGRIGLSADGRSPWTNRIHRDDAARALVHVATRSAPASCYVGVDREPARRDDVVRWLAARLGVTPVRDDGSSSFRSGDRRCVSARLAAAGFTFRYPSYRDGYEDLL